VGVCVSTSFTIKCTKHRVQRMLNTEDFFLNNLQIPKWPLLLYVDSTALYKT
jgi:hypothetical protein